MNALKNQTRRVLYLTPVITFLGFLDTHLLIPVMALYASSLGASTWMVGLIVGVYSIINTPANIIFGRLIDRIGCKVPLIVGLIGDVLSMILYVFTLTPLHLVVVRLLHGASGALVAPSTMSLIADSSTKGKKGRAMAFYGMALASASLVGYPLSGIISDRLGFDRLFIFGAIVVGFGVILSFLLPGNKQRAVTPENRQRNDDFRNILSLFTRKGLIPSYLGIFVQYFTFGGVVTLLPLHIEKLNMGSFETGMLLAVFSAAFIIIQLPCGYLSDRTGRLIPAAAGLLCITASLFLLPLMSTFAALAAVMGLYGIGYGFLFPSISALVTDHTKPEERGMATGIFHALLTAGVAVGAPVIGWIGGLTGTSFGLMIIPIPVILTLAVALICMKSYKASAN
jgi:MFS family permease